MRHILLRLLILIVSLVGLATNAQIKDTILNITLGQSNQRQVLKIIQDKGYKYKQTSETITCKDVEFAGYGWEDVVFYFYKNVLYKISFKEPYVFSEKNIVSLFRPTKGADIIEKLYAAAKSKYRKYDDRWRGFIDGKTRLEFSFTRTMEYECIPLLKKISEESIDDI